MVLVHVKNTKVIIKIAFKGKIIVLLWLWIILLLILNKNVINAKGITTYSATNHSIKSYNTYEHKVK